MRWVNTRRHFKTDLTAMPWEAQHTHSFLTQLTEAFTQPYDKTIPTCHLHIKSIAHSAAELGVAEMVIVMVPPGSHYPKELSCILCTIDNNPQTILTGKT